MFKEFKKKETQNINEIKILMNWNRKKNDEKLLNITQNINEIETKIDKDENKIQKPN